MRALGYLLFLVGIGVAGVFASRHVEVPVEEGETVRPGARIGAWADAAGLGFGLGAVMMIAGGLVVRRDRGSSVAAAGGHAKDGDSAPQLLRRIVERLDSLPTDELPTQSAALKEGLDEILEELVPQTLDRREAMIARMGLGAFAEMIGHFAMMERNAARAWSALIDEAYDEIPGCVTRAREGATNALDALKAQG